MENKEKRGLSRRGFFTGMLAGAGVAGVALAGRKSNAEEKPAQAPTKGPVLYRRTEEVERYLKTMF